MRSMTICFSALAALGFSGAWGAESDLLKGDVRVAPFALKDVRLLDGPFRDAMLRHREYLLRLDPDRLLHTFRLNAGVPTGAEPLGGWERPECEVRGHSVGHYLSACALMYAATGDERVKAKGDAIVAGMVECQKALPSRGFNRGYLSAFPESFIDRVEQGKRVWAPWYTLHKIHAGLIDMHIHCDNRAALEAAKELAAWVKFRIDRLSPDQIEEILRYEHGGMVESLANLYAITGDPDHLQTAKAFTHHAVFDPAVRREDTLNGLHANTQVPKFVGYGRVFELTGDSRYRTAARFFWENVALNRSYVIGGHSDHEHFFPVEEFSKHLSPGTAETCNTYNMLKLARLVFGWDPDAVAMDFYERALFNHILASQDPRTGMMVYLMSLKPGHVKSYSTEHDSFWCCVGTGMENHAKYAESIYFHDDENLWVNLYIASELTWEDKAVVVRQETRFPDDEAVTLTIATSRPVSFGLKLRWPSWATRAIDVRVNGRLQPVAGQPGSYVTITREWKVGDRIDLRLPMSLRVEAMPDDQNIVAVCHGPIVLAGEMGNEGLDDVDFLVRGQTDLHYLPTPSVPVFVGTREDVLAKILPVPGKPLTFETRGLAKPSDITLVPFFRLHRQRQNVYWTVMDEKQWNERKAALAIEAKRLKAEEARIVDAVRPGEQQSETDHKMAGERTVSGIAFGRKWRDAREGWFRYEMKVLPNEPTLLAVDYWGSDSGARTFDILVDDHRIATQSLNRDKPGQLMMVEYAISGDLTHDRKSVSVTFRAHPKNTAGGVFGVRMLRLRGDSPQKPDY